MKQDEESGGNWLPAGVLEGENKTKTSEVMVVSERAGGWAGERAGRQVGGWAAGQRGPAGYLESLPVGPNDSDGVLPPGLLLQPPQLPASLHTQGGREETDSREPMKQGRKRGGRGRHCFVFARGQQTSRTQRRAHTLHTHTAQHSTAQHCTALSHQPTASEVS